MSGSMSAAMRFEDRLGPVTPGDRTRLRQLVEHMRLSVVEATMARDLSEKIELWESYRQARAEAIALLGSTSDAPSTRRLRSV